MNIQAKRQCLALQAACNNKGRQIPWDLYAALHTIREAAC